MEVEVPVFRIEKRNLNITGATLLTTKDAERLSLYSKQYDNDWWLRTHGSHEATAAFVNGDGNINYEGKDVRCSISVRPALVIKDLKSSTFAIGNKFYFNGEPFEIISDKLAFCALDIGESYFKKGTPNDDGYELSDVKRFVDEWFANAQRHSEQSVDCI